MSTNNNFKKSMCWSCEYYCGKRQYKKGILFGDSVNTDDSGTCVNKKSNYNNKTVKENDWCSKYQKWCVLESAIAREEASRAHAQQQRERDIEHQKMKQESEGMHRQLENERRSIETERAEFEHKRWYSSLTAEEQMQYDEAHARKVAEEEEQTKLRAIEYAERQQIFAIEQEKEKAEQIAKVKRRKKNIAIAIISVIVLIISLVSIPAINRNMQKNKLIDYIQENGENNIVTKTITTNEVMTIRSIEYDDIQLSAFETIFVGDLDLFVLKFEMNSVFENTPIVFYGQVSFEYGKFEESAYYVGKMTKGKEYVETVFKGAKIKNCPSITVPSDVKYTYSKNWDKTENISKEVELIWKCVESALEVTQNNINLYHSSLKLW